MSDPESLYALMQQLGMTALRQATSAAKLAEQRKGATDLAAEREARDQVDNLLRLSIAFTARLLVVSCPDPASAIDMARDLEKKLNVGLDHAHSDCPPTLNAAIQKLATTAAMFTVAMADLVERAAATGSDPFKAGAGTEAREQTYALARAAVVFTVQLIVAFSDDPEAAREPAGEMEDGLVEFLDAAPWYEEDL